MPSFLDCSFSLPALLLGMGNLKLAVQSPLLRSLSLDLPYSGDEAMIFRSSPGLEASWRKEGLNPGLWSQILSPVALGQTQICYANSPGSVVAGYIV